MHEDATNKITLAYKACKTAIQRRYDDLMRDSEQIRSSKGRKGGGGGERMRESRGCECGIEY